MAHTIHTQPIPFGALTTHRLVSTVSNWLAELRRWNQVRRTVNELRRLSARQLDDIGLTPADVDRLADGSF